MNIEKIDLVKEDKSYYKASKKIELIKFGKIPYLTLAGKGEPAGQDFLSKLSLIYPLAYGVKKLSKQDGQDFAVPKLEALWWVEGKKDPRKTPKSKWQWKLLIRMPNFVSKALVEKAKKQVADTKKINVDKIFFETLNEGKCIQIMHLGPYSEEEKTIDIMSSYMNENSLKANGHHHEIYLSDPNKTKPEKMKTILRQAVRDKQ